MFANLTEETATNNGVIFTLTGITDTSIPFGASFVDGQKVHYVAHGNNGKCAGIGTYNSGANTITQDDVWQWTPGGGVVEYPASNLTLAGTVVVYCDVFAVDNRLALFEEDDTDLALQAVKPTISLNFRDNKYEIYDGISSSFVRKLLADILTISNGAATGFNAINLLNTSSINNPRLVFDPLTGESFGLLHEGVAANDFIYSEDFTNAAWGKAGLNVLSTAIQSTIAGKNWQKLEVTTTGAANRSIVQSYTTATGKRTIKLVLKVAQILYICLRLTGASIADSRTRVNLLTGDWSADTNGISIGCSVLFKSINDYVVIEFSYNALAGTDNLILIPQDTYSLSVGSTLTAGDGLLIDYAQSEFGNFSTSYIKTLASAVSRLVDKYSRTIVNEINPREGTFVFEGILSGLNSAGSAMICVSDGSTENRINLGFDSAGKPQAYIVNGGVSSVNQTIDAGYVAGTPFIAAMSFKANSCILSFNGVSVEDTSVTIPSGLNQFAIGRLASGLTTEIYTGTIAETHYVPKAESAAVLNAITSGVLTYD